MGNKKVVERIFKKLLSATNFKITCVIVFFCKANNCLNSSLIVKFLTIFLIGWGLAIIIKDMIGKKMLLQFKYWKMFIAFFASYCITIVLNRDIAFFSNIRDAIWFFITIFLFVAFPTGDKTEEIAESCKIFNIFLGLSFVFAAGSLIFVFTNTGGSDTYTWGFYANRLFGLYRSPNYGAVYSSVSLTIALYLLRWGACSRKKSAYLIFNVICQFLYIVYSGSNTGKVALVACLVMYFGYGIVFGNAIKKRVINGLLCVVSAVLVLFCIDITKSLTVDIMNSLAAGANVSKQQDHDVSCSQNLQSSSTAKIEIPDSAGAPIEKKEPTSVPSEGKPFDLERKDYGNGELGNGRVYNWKVSLKVFKDYPLFGTSMRKYSVIVKNYDDSWRIQNSYPTLENDFFSLLVCTGVIGLALFLLSIIPILKTILTGLWTNRRSPELIKAIWPLLSISVVIGITTMFTDAVIFSNALQSIAFWIALGYSYRLCLNELQQRKKQL
ncbi:O-antigen ligase family protein [Bittarella massiliensis (ex Durand et al. 2017)]|uniref:O-antigen ligase family protein n=1 Tax=Bittarella massiliensis (ex Durand et al. 2017) TaxID=1720313 RepID=UPI001AA1008D|nr:O-antigen ligase family protein [Bittarella massiliensis (ex Durand et al. 2017)]MBO1679273.1 O-antigen ligase family protein [Bittarella massiliensis (ex Durand et al. 2017)]